MVLEASSIRRRNPSVQNMVDSSILQKYWLQREKVRRKWTPADALAASKLHFYVHSFAMKFASTALSKIPSRYGQQPPPTRQELERIKRALYRFEIYRNIFPPRSYKSHVANVDGTEMLNKVFFSKFAPWENEQLACIYDFLVEEVSPAFNDVVRHDIVWGSVEIDYADEIDNGFIQRLLADGLQRLHDITTADTYEARYKLLESRDLCGAPYGEPGGYVPCCVLEFLHEPLQECHNQLNGSSLEEKFMGWLCPRTSLPFFNDSDVGPEKALQWGHARGFSLGHVDEEFINQDVNWPIRAWGYVFWNLERLNASGILENEWDWKDPRESSGSSDNELLESWEAREAVYRRGITGYWNGEDESGWVRDREVVIPKPLKRRASR
ncbi:MAG: hypothetical protein M1839_006486 [Geoglossum umbratile]|nr:MAG: hypothetical protein M1839_006486 [Geoglossum umbratile]